MGLFDAIAMGQAVSGHEIPALKGSFSVTIGDVLQAMIGGGRQTHIFGPNVQFVADPSEVLGKLLHSYPILTAAALGMEGNSNFVFGHNTSATYGGPQYTIQRCQHTKYIYKDMAGLSVGGSCPTDELYVMNTKILIAVALLTSLTLDLVIHFGYPEFGGSGEEGQAQIPEILKNVSWDITSRALAALAALEGDYLLVRQEWFVAKADKDLETLEVFMERLVIRVAGLGVDELDEAQTAVLAKHQKLVADFTADYEKQVAAALK